MAHNPLDKKSQAWSALFSEPMAALVQRYTASVGFDRRLWRADIAGSQAHARMLAAQQVITPQDLSDIERGLAQIVEEIEQGRFEWKLELEDVHLNIEARLTQLVGDAGKRLHTGRSRNDQVATDLRLWLRGEIDVLTTLLVQMQQSLLDVAAANVDTVMPGFTHLQVAQPVSFAHHLLAYVEMFARDAERLADVRRRTNRLPLGAAALAGTSYPLDRHAVARELGFEGVCENSLDAVSDRDFAIEFAAFASISMVHVSRLAEEIVLWMSQNFGFIDLADRYCTGSSIMPQKRNPDVAELARGKSGRVVGHLMALITLMKGQPLTYNKDNQEDKEPLFDSVDTLADTLRIMGEMIAGLQVKPEAMRAAAMKGYATATDLADHLVKRGVAFRDAHEVVAHAVKLAMQRGVDLAEVPIAELRALHPAIDDEARAALTLQASLQSRTTHGGTAPARVREQLQRHRDRLGERAMSASAALRQLLGTELPLLQAPMAGVQGSALAIAVCNAGALGALPCAMLTPDAMRKELATIVAQTKRPFNVNFFCHPQPTPDAAREARWHAVLAPFHAEFGIDAATIVSGPGRLPFSAEAIAVLAEFKPAVVSFHFGLPPPELLAPLRTWGCRVLGSATTVDEALWLQAHGVDAVIAQGVEAGGHRGMFLSDDLSTQCGTFALLPQIVRAVKLPVIAAGGIADARGVAAALALGAAGVQVGTAYLLCPEATTSAVHRAALKSDAARVTALTNLFTGRPARSIVNRLMRELGPLSAAAPAFPLAVAAIAPLRAKAEARGSGEFSPLWAGQNTSGCKEVPAAQLTRELAQGLAAPH